MLADDFRLRDLSPPGFTDVTDVGTALAGLRGLLNRFDTARLVDSDVYEIGNVTYLRARPHFVHPKAGERMLESGMCSPSVALARIRVVSQVARFRSNRRVVDVDGVFVAAPGRLRRVCEAILIGAFVRSYVPCRFRARSSRFRTGSAVLRWPSRASLSWRD